MRKQLAVAVALASMTLTGQVQADIAAAKKWIESEFQPSSLSQEQQVSEMQWFIDAAKPYAGMEINVLSETIPTHTYESTVLAKAFEEITGIKVNHQLLGEGEVVQAVQTQMQTKRNLYDAYVNDSDLIGTHSRLQLAYSLTDFMNGAGKDVTSPTLDLDDFMGLQLQRVLMVRSTSYPRSSSPTYTGSAKTGLIVKICRHSSKLSTVTIWVCQLTGRLTKISQNSSLMTSRKLTAQLSTVTWTTVSALLT